MTRRTKKKPVKRKKKMDIELRVYCQRVMDDEIREVTGRDSVAGGYDVMTGHRDECFEYGDMATALDHGLKLKRLMGVDSVTMCVIL